MKYRAAPSFACMLCGKVHTSTSVSYLLPEDMNAWECSLVGPSCVKPMAMSDGLYQFLSDWYRWATTGVQPDLYLIDPHYGLCPELMDWSHAYRKNTFHLSKELRDLFVADGLDETYPFRYPRYEEAERQGLMHRDPNRLMWVRAKLAAHKAAINRTTA